MDKKYSYQDARRILKKFWGYDDFRPGQSSLVKALLSDRDVLGVMPTGAGKSICYQVPALLFPGVTIIISPLISLMEDQVDALKARGIPATAVNSLHPLREIQTVCRHTGNPGPPAGPPKILYVSPERLQSAAFRRFISDIPVSFLCVDEAHCISKWGHDFRPEYLQIHSFIDFLKSFSSSSLHIAAFTATADSNIRKEILNELHLRRPFCLTTGFDRPNLFFAVEHPSNKREALSRHIARHPGECGIIYCSTRRTVERVTADLQRKSIFAEKYHAGMPSEERTSVQNRFMKGETPIVVATNAFGMGVDKPDVRFVIHYDMPKDMESYYQEAGRAGRDGFPSECVLLYSPKDVKIGRLFIERNLPEKQATSSGFPPKKFSHTPSWKRFSRHGSSPKLPEALRRHRDSEFEKLRSMIYYAAGRVCLRAFMLEYFGEHAPSYCGKCSVCLAGTLPVNPEARAELMRGAPLRVPNRTLHDSENPQNVPSLTSFDSKSSHLFPNRMLRDTGNFRLTTNEYELYRSLLSVRSRISKDKNISAEKVFPDRILRAFCHALPLTIPQMLMIGDISILHVFRYGKLFLKEIIDYCYFHKIKI